MATIKRAIEPYVKKQTKLGSEKRRRIGVFFWRS
jgi:hypothetical protein